MKREDLRSRIIPTTIGNIDESQKMKKRLNTTDLIYLDSYDEQYDNEKTNIERRISATDYAQMNNAYIYNNNITTCTGRQTTWVWLRSIYYGASVFDVEGNGEWNVESTVIRDAGLCPSLHYRLPSDISGRSALQFFKWQKNRDESEKLEQLDIREVKDTNRKNYISYITNWRICKNKSRRRFK